MHAPEARGRLASMAGSGSSARRAWFDGCPRQPPRPLSAYLVRVRVRVRVKVRASVVLCALKLLLVNRLGGAWDDARGRDGA